MRKNTRSYAVLAKPAGARCNLACRYCFYLEKSKLLNTSVARMSSAVLESYIRQYIEIHGDVEIQFPWQGGEPTLCGLDFFPGSSPTAAALRTRSAHFPTRFRPTAFCWITPGRPSLPSMVSGGLSIDGPQKLHDSCRMDHAGQPTFERVLAAMAVLKNTVFHSILSR